VGCCHTPLRIAVMLLPLTTTATRLHTHLLDAPDVATQEVNRCLKLVDIAASRRRRGARRAPQASLDIERTAQPITSDSIPTQIKRDAKP
jgi:hypothetical protein